MNKRFRLTVIELWLVLILLGSLILTLWPQLEVVKEAQYQQECVANIITIMMAVRLYEARERAEYRDNTIKGLIDKGYLQEELYCPATAAYYRINPRLGLVSCPSGRPRHSWPAEE